MVAQVYNTLLSFTPTDGRWNKEPTSDTLCAKDDVGREEESDEEELEDESDEVEEEWDDESDDSPSLEDCDEESSESPSLEDKDSEEEESEGNEESDVLLLFLPLAIPETIQKRPSIRILKAF